MASGCESSRIIISLLKFQRNDSAMTVPCRRRRRIFPATGREMGRDMIEVVIIPETKIVNVDGMLPIQRQNEAVVPD